MLPKENPLAIVGMACRFPGDASSLENFWALMCGKTDAIVQVPKSRWDIRKYFDKNPDRNGKSYVCEGGFLSQDIRQFDAGFFSISPREAVNLDPQQRLLLEVSWEAIEDSGVSLHNLQKSKVGVFVGGFCLDSKIIQLSSANKDRINSFTSSSVTMSILSNRISHAFDLTGPSMTVDTACSSSLVATHLACQNIWCGNADIALIGGVNVMLHPEIYVAMCKGRFLSQKGRCYAFDKRADGYVRGEGCGIVMVMPLEKALEYNCRIYAKILNTGVNQDGRTAGISLPNSHAQEKLIRSVYAGAEISPEQLDYIEAHGTGTQQGDYAEATALDKVLSRSSKKCIVGSVKTNIGHLEAAAGVAGLIKTALCLYHGAVPPNLHFVNPNEKLEFDKLNIRILNDLEKLPVNKRSCYAGVNSFGYGGTNAHVLLQSNVVNESPAKTQVIWPIIYTMSAREHKALQSLAGVHKNFLDSEQIDNDAKLANVLYSLNMRRTHHNDRAAIVASNMESLKKSLFDLEHGDLNHTIKLGEVPALKKKMTFVYTGMGPQWYGMGQQLIKENQIFKDFLARCDAIFISYSGWSLYDEMVKSESTSQVSRADVAQPLNFVIQVGITKILQSWGIVPDCVVGHSVGEISAAYVSGVLSLEDALLVSYHRSSLQQQCANDGGGMLAANISAEDVQSILDKYSDISIAAHNSNNSITLAGNLQTLHEISDQLTKNEIFNRILKVNIAYHSGHMDKIHRQLVQSLAKINPRNYTIDLYSTVTGTILEGSKWDNEYWWHNVRQPVLFRQAIDSLLDSECFNVLIDIGPHPVTKNYIRDRMSHSSIAGKVLFSLYREQPETNRLYELISELYTIGYDLNWKNIIPAGGKLVRLPNYPWQRQFSWIDDDNTLSNRQVESPYLFLSNRLVCPKHFWEVELNELFFPYIADHKLDSMIVFPGAGFVEAGLQVASIMAKNVKFGLKDIVFEKLLVYQDEALQKIITEYDAQRDCYVVWSSDSRQQNTWNIHATGSIAEHPASSIVPSLVDLKVTCSQKVNPDLIYFLFAKEGLHYGEKFRGIKELWVSPDGNEVLAHISITIEESDTQYLLHPVVLDSAFHSLMSVDNELTDMAPYIPAEIEKVNFYQPVGQNVWAYTMVLEKNEKIIRENLWLYNEQGQICCEIQNFVCKRFEFANSNDTKLKLADKLYRPGWELVALNEVSSKNIDMMRTVVLLIDDDDFSQKVAELLVSQLENVSLVAIADIKLWRQDITILNSQTDDAIKQFFADFAGDGVRLLAVIGGASFESPSCITYEQLLNACVALTMVARVFNQIEVASKSFIFVTHNARIVVPDDRGDNCTAASLNGLAYLMNNELLTVSAKTIDLPLNLTKEIHKEFIQELLSLNADIDVALRSAGRYVMQMVYETSFLPDISSDFVADTETHIKSQATYLITGGTSGFGLELAKWLVTKGAQRLVLVSRRGISSTYAEHTVAKLRKHGAEIIIKAIDISDRSQTHSLVKLSNTVASPLKGVFHCAMVLDDAFLINMSRDSYDQVMRPKICGTLNLHFETEQLPLDYFVMTSSIASLMGNVGQANYIVANSFLDVFVYYRRARGLVATTLNIGVLSGVGVIARSDELSHYTDLLSITKTPAQDVIMVLDAMLARGSLQEAIFDFNWHKWEKIDKKAANSSRFKGIMQIKRAQRNLSSETSDADDLINIVLNDYDAAVERILLEVKKYLASVLQCSPEKINDKENINNMGIDSLMMAEFRHQIVVGFDVEMRMVELLKGVSVNEIVEMILARLRATYDLSCS